MFRRIRSQCQCYNKVKIPMFGRIRSEFPVFGRIMSEFNKVKIPVFGRIRSEFQCLEGLSQNSNVWKDNQLRSKLPLWCCCELQCMGQQSSQSGSP